MRACLCLCSRVCVCVCDFFFLFSLCVLMCTSERNPFSKGLWTVKILILFLSCACWNIPVFHQYNHRLSSATDEGSPRWSRLLFILLLRSNQDNFALYQHLDTVCRRHGPSPSRGSGNWQAEGTKFMWRRKVDTASTPRPTSFSTWTHYKPQAREIFIYICTWGKNKKKFNLYHYGC